VGATELFPDRVCVRQAAATRTCFLRDVEAFDDGSSDVVWLFTPGRLPGLRPAVGVPAGDEAARALLLEVLERAGVPRGVDEARRTIASADPPLLVAGGGWRPPVPGFAIGCVFVALGGAVLERPWDILVACLSLVALVGAALLGRLGRVTFRTDRIVAQGTVLAWDDVLGFSAREPGRVHLHPRPGFAVLPPVVRTPDAAALEAVRALLLSRGVPDVGRFLV